MKSLAKFLGFTPSDSAADKPADNEGRVENRPQNTTIDNNNPKAITKLNNEPGLNTLSLPIDRIVGNPYQPRKRFNEEALQELAASIREFGVIQPLIVRNGPQEFELIAGERRLRAAKLAGLREVPAIIKDLSDKEMAEIALVENLQREDLHYLEEAEGFQQLIANFGFTQEELARRVAKFIGNRRLARRGGKNQSTIANKLRLLKLDPRVRQTLVADNLTERHARSLLKLTDARQQQKVLATIRQQSLNVRQTEDLIGEINAGIAREMSNKPPARQKVVKIIKDVRIFINTINNVVGEMRKAGLNITLTQAQDDQYINLNLRIPKNR